LWGKGWENLLINKVQGKGYFEPQKGFYNGGRGFLKVGHIPIVHIIVVRLRAVGNLTGK